VKAPVTPYRRDCLRLRTQAAVPPLARLAGPADLDTLQDLVRRTAVQSLGSRFSDGSFRPLYTAEAERTCRAEVLYHWGRFFTAAGSPAGTVLRALRLGIRMEGERFLDIRAGFADLHDPESYRASQQFGLEAWMAGDDGILYRSVRDPGGFCAAAIRPGVAGMAREQGEVRFQWDGERFQAVS
jgi:hypothetical protein